MPLKVKPSGTEGYRTAEVTLGGMDTQEVSSQNYGKVKSKKACILLGKFLDVTGHLGCG